MGVYIFQSNHGPWIKVGHFRPTRTRPNVYYRVARRGFYSCVRPDVIRDRVSMDDVTLIRWYPNLTTRNESALHRHFSEGSVGEWHPANRLADVITHLEGVLGGQSSDVSRADADRARIWAGGRRAKR